MKLSILFLSAAAFFCLVCIFLLIERYRQNKNISRLADSINDFTQNGKALEFSLRDNNLARLHNGICDLENLIHLEKTNTLNQTKSNTEFISDVSHQLKTPLAALRLYCEMENAQNPNEHTEKELLLIEKMEKLVQSLLRLEKIRSDAYIMNFQQNEINDIIKQTLSEFYPLFPNKKYIISGKSVLRCDKAWLSEALGNIIKNASEHTSDNGTIEIETSDSQKSTILEIRDNGGGIAEEDLPNLFTRFYRAENALPTSAGIGLAITKAIIEKHHGIISAENKNDGLCVTICIPHIDGCETI